MPEAGQRFYMEFGFLRASTADYTQPNPVTKCIVMSFDEFKSYLLTVDERAHTYGCF